MIVWIESRPEERQEGEYTCYLTTKCLSQENDWGSVRRGMIWRQFKDMNLEFQGQHADGNASS